MMHAILSMFVTITPVCDIIVTDQSGDTYIVGSGDTCQDAMVSRDKFPVFWREIEFRQYSIIED
jgi:hypothetical protein